MKGRVVLIVLCLLIGGSTVATAQCDPNCADAETTAASGGWGSVAVSTFLTSAVLLGAAVALARLSPLTRVRNR